MGKFKQLFINISNVHLFRPYAVLQADTIFYRNYARQNHGYKYILVVVDCFSRKNWVRPLRTTTADETAKRLDEIISGMPWTPRSFASDQGNEFNLKHPSIFKTLVDKFGMLVYTLKGPHKAAIAERFIRTLKGRIERHFTENRTYKWIDVLQQLSEDINNTENRSIGMTPNEVTFENRSEVFKRLYGEDGAEVKCKFNIGDRVRIPVSKNIFDKGYTPNWSENIYIVSNKRSDGEVCYYRLKTLNGEWLDKFFYEQEMNLVLKEN